ncbi:MAG: hypothetical protein M3O02_02485 [Acidobacteriota bacterium]|nr:hypothetical protein [Acidobacteriota bacterium]
MSASGFVCAAAAALALAAPFANAQRAHAAAPRESRGVRPITLRSAGGHTTTQALRVVPLPATSNGTASLTVRLPTARRGTRGELWLVVAAEASGTTAARITLRIPLSSTEDVYGESRSCTAGPGGARELTFTAGMDEENFADFAASAAPHAMHLLLNKYLCRALAAPFHCDGQEVRVPADWTRWSLAPSASLQLSSAAPATAIVSSVAIKSTGVPFDSARCAEIAPSEGMCCVAGKSTEWHCGGTPVGEGWHQVSGECFHRETAGRCDSRTVFPSSR